MRKFVVTENTRLEKLPRYLQNPLWKQYKGLNFYIFSRSTMKNLAEHGYTRALSYIGRTIQITNKKKSWNIKNS